MSQMFLNRDELIDLTSYKYKAMQIRWLSSRGYKFEIGADGRPKVLRTHIERILGGETQQKHYNRYTEQPNFDLLEQL